MEGGGSLRKEREEEEATKQRKKKVKHSPEDNKKQEADMKDTKVDGKVTARKRRRKTSRVPAEVTHHEDFLSSKPSPGTVTRGVLGTLS